MKIKLSICIMILIFILSACNASSIDRSDEVFERSFDGESSSENDFGGKKFTIYENVYYLDSSDTYLGYEYDSPYASILQERIAGIQSNMNCQINLVKNLEINLMLTAGVHPADILIGGAGYGGFAIGFFVPVDEYSDIIDITDSFRWGDPNVLEQTMCHGTMYAVIPNSWPGFLGGYFACVLSNNDILYKNGYSNPHEYVESGVWSREKIAEIANYCYNKEKPIYGFETYMEWFYRECFYTNRVRYAKLDYTGNYVNGYNSQEAINAVDWGKEFYQMIKGCFDNHDGGKLIDFYAGQSVFALERANLLMNLIYTNEVDEFSILPFPNGPDVEYGRWSGTFWHDCVNIAIPYTEEDVSESARILDLVFAPFDDANTFEKLCDYYTRNFFFDNRDIETLFTAMKNSEYSYIGYTDLPKQIIDSIIMKARGASAASAVQSVAPKFDTEIEEVIIPNKIGLKNYFGDAYIPD